MVLASFAYGLCHVLAGREFLSRMYKGFLWSVRRLKGLKASAVGLSVVQKQPALFSLARVRRQRLAQTPQSAKSVRGVATRYQASHFWQPWVLGS